MANDLKTNIQNSKWSDANKQHMLGLLPMLGKNLSLFLFNESSKLGFNYSAESLNEAMQACADANQQLAAGSSLKAQEVLQQGAGYPWWDNGLYILPWVLDMNQFFAEKKIVPDQDLQHALVEFKAKMFEYLPQPEVNQLLEKNALALTLQKADLLHLLKKYVYIKGWNNDAKIVKPFVDALYSNAETFPGQQNLGTVSALIKDFVISSKKSGADLSAYDITKYLISNKAAQSLNQQNKEAFAELLKIFLWLQEPVVTEMEAFPEKYSNEEEGPQVVQASDFVNYQRTTLPPNLPKPPIKPINLEPQLTSPQQGIQQKIDKKLKELEERVSHNKNI